MRPATAGMTAIAVAGLIGPAAGAPPPPPQAQSIFTPGLYETQTRNPAISDHGATSTECLLFADVETFRRDTMARYLRAPQFRAICRLSEAKPLPDGFAFAMDCGEVRSVTTYTFAKDRVTSVTRTRVVSRPAYSSTIVTLSRRIGECQGGALPGKT